MECATAECGQHRQGGESLADFLEEVTEEPGGRAWRVWHIPDRATELRYQRGLGKPRVGGSLEPQIIGAGGREPVPRS